MKTAFESIKIDLLIKMFLIFREQEQFVSLCLQQLNTHLSLALTGGMSQAVLGDQATPLRQLLFK